MNTIKQILHHPSVFYVGPDISIGPLPALIYFALSAEESLSLDPYNQPVKILHGKPIRIFSFTLPCHGPLFNNTHAMQCWSNEVKNNQNFLNFFIQNCSNVINSLIQENIIDKNFVSVAGLSRGAFIATHLAAENEHIKTVLGLAPLTILEFLEEFKDTPNCSIYNLNNLYPKLFNKRLRFYIGNRDVRVGTDKCFEFINGLTDFAFENGVRSPQVELVISPSVGHKGHGTLLPTFQDGINWILSGL